MCESAVPYIIEKQLHEMKALAKYCTETLVILLYSYIWYFLCSQRRKKQEAHRAYLQQLEMKKRMNDPVNRPSTEPTPGSASSDILGPPPVIDVNPNSEYSKYERTIAKGKGTYDFDKLDNLGPDSKPIIKKNPIKQITFQTPPQTKDSAKSDSSSRSSDSADRKANIRASIAASMKNSRNEDRYMRPPNIPVASEPKQSPNTTQNDSKLPETEAKNSNPEAAKKEPSKPKAPKPKKDKGKKQEENEFKRRKVPKDDRSENSFSFQFAVFYQHSRMIGTNGVEFDINSNTLKSSKLCDPLKLI